MSCNVQILNSIIKIYYFVSCNAQIVKWAPHCMVELLVFTEFLEIFWMIYLLFDFTHRKVTATMGSNLIYQQLSDTM